ncbi:serine/threonine-protein kinase ATM isoform X1 [Lucilia sericata]|uniref:serine/threonine-protein kinase ATM isoform X1 n=1 Tax=Lucilia sericata TaxID=13632 RepID=UPI0018A8622A|nr:serine/threonine-protein kinase ATM isoform X1 [Lucilia sericata]
MSTFLSLINNLCAELRSEKVTTRNKAAEQLDDHLSSSKNELFAQLDKRNDMDVSWTTIFNSAIDATIKHAIKVDEAKNSKSYQTMCNKNYVFAAIVQKLINYNLEDPEHLFSKSTLFNALQEGFKSRPALEYFSDTFLKILNEALFKSPVYVRDIKLNEFSIILSYLFENNLESNNLFLFASLKSINKTIELSHEYVQMSADVIAYFPEVKDFARKAIKDSQKADIIKLYYLMVSQHSVDYHNVICNGLQELLPIIIGFYQIDMKAESKELLFQSVLISLQTLYPYIKQGNTNTINIVLCDTLPKTLRKIRTMVDMEIKERSKSFYQQSRFQQNDRYLKIFIKMSALIIYLINWHFENNSKPQNEEEEETMASRSKISKLEDQLEVLLNLVQNSKGEFNEIWLSILAELVREIPDVINITNYQPLLCLNLNILKNYKNNKNLKSIRLCLTELLSKEKQFVAIKSIPHNYGQEEWIKIVKILITDTSSDNEIITEKQLTLQQLIKHHKLTAEDCTQLVNSFMTNAALKRTECVLTIQDILKQADVMGLDKTSPLIGQTIQWLYGERDKNEAKTILLNIEPVKPALIAETCAIAVINFLDETTLKTSTSTVTPKEKSPTLEMLQFKYNRKFLCLERHGKLVKSIQQKQNICKTNEQKNCLFQANYELLMRTLNFETSKGTTCKDIILDLQSLLKISLLMESLLRFEVFDDSTSSFMQCPLIKRIGFFLSHLELQFKNNLPKNMERSILCEVLNILDNVIVCFTSNECLLQYLEKQPIEEMVQFLGATLKLSAKKQTQQREFDDWTIVTETCLRLLATLCASTSHWNEAFEHITSFCFNIKIHKIIILRLTKIFCLQKSHYKEIGHWFVEHLKTIFKLYHTNIEIMNDIVEMLPAIFVYIQQYDDCLDNMLVAMFGLFKISFRKSYSVQLTTKIINSVCYIVRDCRDIYIQDNFRNICLSVVKFLPFTSLEVQYAAINTLTSLMDINWLKNSKCDIEIYYDFCENIYETIEWKKLQVPAAQAEGPDQLQNSIALNVQLLVSLLAFSCYHRENALQELSFVCALYKLTEADLNEFHGIATFYNTSLRDVIKPCISSAIHTWISKSYPILKFPFYLCYKSKHDFVADNLEEIITCLLIYGKSADLTKLKDYGSQADLLKIAIPILRAFILSSQCPANTNSEFKNNIKNVLSFDLQKIKNEANTWKIMFTLVDILKDDKHSRSMAGFPIFFQTTKWYNIDYKCLQSVLNLYINNSTNEPKPDILKYFISKYPLRLVKTFGALKKSCSECIFPIDSLKQFYKFYSLADMVLDTLQHASIAVNLANYFTRDIIYYCLHCMETAALKDLQILAFKALEKFLDKVKHFKDIEQLMDKHLTAISKTIVQLYKNTSCLETKEKAAEVCEHLIQNYKNSIKDKEILKNEFSVDEKFANIIAILETLPDIGENSNDWQNFFKIFLENKNYTVDNLKMLQQQISKSKRLLANDSALLYRLIRHLLQIVRETQVNAISLEALKCLGEIGPLNLNQISYYFEADFCTEEQTDDILQIQHFYKAIYLILEKLLDTFHYTTHSYVVEVAQYLVNSKHGQDLLENFPYFSVFQSDLSLNYLDNYDSIPALDWLSTLKTTESYDYEQWICKFISQIYQQCNWLQFQELAAKDTYFAEHSLIPFIRLLLQCSEQPHMNTILNMLEYFFEEFLQHHTATNVSELKKVFKDKRVINMILNICECIRVNNNWNLPLKLLNVALACNYCQAYFLSIIYLELWAIEEQEQKPQPGAIGKTRVEIMSNLHFQQIARKAYDSIGCNDAISGFINPLNSRLDYLNLTNNWSDILIESNDIATNSNANYLCNTILKRNGMFNLVNGDVDKSSVDYEICWRLCRWDTVVEGHSKVDTLNDMKYEFEKHHFNALKCLYNKEENNALAAITKSRHCVLNILKEISVECLQSVYKYMTWLQLLQQSEDFCLIQFSKSVPVEQIFEKWQLEANDLLYGNFSCKELILSHQISLFQTAGIRANRKINEFYKENPIEKCLLKCVRDCKAAGEINLAKRYIAILKNMPIDNVQLKVCALLENVDICMKTDKPEITKAILHHIFKNKEFQFCLQRVTAMQMNGEYLMETNTETFDIVLNKYFLGSLEALKKFDSTKEAILQRYPKLFELSEFAEFEEKSKKSAYEIIAKYADREYTQLNTYINSDEFNMKRQIMELNRQTASTVGRQVRDRDKQISANFMKRTSNIDEQEIQLMEQKLTTYLCVAVENYIKYTCLDAAITSPVIYRIIGLWFANKQNETLRTKIQENISSVPSYKFICALNQMTARLNSKNSEFITLLKDIMIRCVQEHPHQTLYQLYPIVYGYIDGTENKTDYRSKIAQDIIAKAKNKTNANIIKQLESVIPALIDFANTEISADNKTSATTLSDKLRKHKNLDAIHCPTIDLPVRNDLKYTITSIIKWDHQVSLVGGINAPKKLLCLCADGRTRPQLLKGKDDLRQDAVMQQVFCMINNLLKQEPAAVERKLLIRTYKVVPLSTRSGLLEWCENTVPIGIYLTAARKKYRPSEYSVSRCRQLAHTHLKAAPERRFEVHTHICQSINPVFHYFFFEKFSRPGIWFERRLAYINSVATTSMVGFILGLGDRHLQNILIDEKTAEVIHIDFGIAFEQGKIMPTPETVPFRLTREIVAPMGICGANGVFKKSCETTMTILRKHQDVITTILEVLLYDPLYIWKVIPQVDDENQNVNKLNEGTNYIAQRALLAVQNKLEGKQKGIFGTSSVAVQVERLINEAMSNRNLAMLFPGWDPYL